MGGSPRRWMARGPRDAAVAIALAACGTSVSSAHDASTSARDAGSRDASGREAAQKDVEAATDAGRRDVDRDSALPKSGPALPTGEIGHAGRWLTDPLGRVLLVHGVNLVNKDPPYYPSAEGFSDTDAVWLADNGFRVARVGVLATGLMPTPGVVDLGYVAHIADSVRQLAAHGIYALIDFHQDGYGPSVGSDGFPAWMTLTGKAKRADAGFPFYYIEDPALQQAFQSFWDDARGPADAGLQDAYSAMFTALATKLAGEPMVIGYDLFNEPWPGTTWSACLDDANGCPSLDKGELGPAYARAVAAIRGAGDHHLVFGEPFNLFNFGDSKTHMPVPGGDPNAGMAFHVYPLAATGAPAVIDNALAWAKESGGALFNTEWGASTDSATLVTESTALDSALVPWIFWSFVSEVVSSFDAAPAGANLVTSSVAVLVQPYPLVVAGTPTSLVVDPVARTMSFAWSTARAGGGSFPAGTVTTFEVPQLTYPSGYTARVAGGVVTSSACSPLLTVQAGAGESMVSVEVTPGGACP